MERIFGWKVEHIIVQVVNLSYICRHIETVALRNFECLNHIHIQSQESNVRLFLSILLTCFMTQV
jgi:hypothetical protein